MCRSGARAGTLSFFGRDKWPIAVGLSDVLSWWTFGGRSALNLMFIFRVFCKP